MVCYIVPITATIIQFIRRKNRKDHHNYWLNLMFLGASLFGIIDPSWTGELFSIGSNWMGDLTLGFTITAGIIMSWGLIVQWPNIIKSTRLISHRLGIFK